MEEFPNFCNNIKMENDQNYRGYPITYKGVIIKEEPISDEEGYGELAVVAYSPLPHGVIKDEPPTGDAYDEEDDQVISIANSFQIFPPYLFYSTLDYPTGFLQYNTCR